VSFVVKKLFYHRVHKEHKELHKNAANVLEICVYLRFLSAFICEKSFALRHLLSFSASRFIQ